MGSNIDFGPTLLDILNINGSGALMGSSLLEEGTGSAILNHDPPKWITLGISTNTPVAKPLSEEDFKFIEYSNSLLK